MDKGIEALIADIGKEAAQAKNYKSLTVTLSVNGVLALIAALEQAQKENKSQLAALTNTVELWNEQRTRIEELEQWQRCEHSKKRNAVIDGLAQCGEAAWEIEEYMQQWDKEHPLELAAYKAELESAPNGMMQLSNELAEMKLIGKWVARSAHMPDPNDKRRVCVYTPNIADDIRYRLVPASLFKAVCSDATHWHYIEPPV